MTQTRAEEPVLAGVVGHPISHSLSPLIHAFWAKRAGIDGYYIPLDVAPTYDDFARAMDGLRAIGFAGVNVTLPHKEHALRYADGASAEAKSAGAANVLTFAGPGVEAHNSDIVGFAAAVREQYSAPGQKPPAGPALILGAGGAARGVALALKELGVAEIAVDGLWRVVDATALAPRSSLTRIATGRDAADTAFLSIHGAFVDLTELTVSATADELPSDDVRELVSLT